MKKQFQFINNEKGFFLPIIFAISFIILLLVMSFIKIYKSELLITEKLVEQYEIDTTIQMGVEMLKRDLQEIDESEGVVTYTLPGQVETNILFKAVDDNAFELEHHIQFPDRSSYEIVHYFVFETESEYE